MVRFQDCYIFADLPRTMMFALVAILGRPPRARRKKDLHRVELESVNRDPLRGGHATPKTHFFDVIYRCNVTYGGIVFSLTTVLSCK